MEPWPRPLGVLFGPGKLELELVLALDQRSEGQGTLKALGHRGETLAGFCAKRQSRIVATHTVRPTEPKVLCTWSFPEKVCQLLFYILREFAGLLFPKEGMLNPSMVHN